MNRYGKRCVLYPRVSTEMQVDGYSLEGQKNMLTRFADREEMIVVDTYEDAGKSGKSIEGRPAFQKMLRDIEDGLDIDYILVYKLSRFGRNAADILNSLELVQSYGVNLICIEEGIDSSQTSGKLLISVLSAVAEIERENIIEQTMNGRREKARQGGWNGGFAPYGYTLEDNKLMIEETEAVAIRKIFELYTSSEIGLGGIANQLNLQGIRKIPRQNGTLEDWTGHFIKLILDNPVYCGKIAYGRRTKEKVKGTKNDYQMKRNDDYILTEGQHKGIVSEEVWEKAHAKRLRTGVKQPSKIGRDRVHLLSGLLRCPVCGSPMYTNKHAWTNKDGTYKEIYYYVCSRNRMVRGKHCEYKAMLKKTDIEPMVIEAIREIVRNEEYAQAIKKRIGVQIDTKAVDKELEGYQAKLKEVDLNKTRLEREIDSLPADAKYRERKLHDMTLRLDSLYDVIVELEEKIEDARLRRDAIKQQAITLENIYKIMVNFDCVYNIINDEEKRNVVTALIKEIEIYRNDESEYPLKRIGLNFPVFKDGGEVTELLWDKGNTVETGVTVKNKSLFTDTADYVLLVELTKNGARVKSSECSLQAVPGETARAELPFAVPQAPGEYTVDASLCLRENARWAAKGHCVAFGQWHISRKAPEKPCTLPVTLVEGDCNIGVHGRDFSLLFTKNAQGSVISYRWKGRELLQRPIALNFWRAPTDNDTAAGMELAHLPFKTAGLYAKLRRAKAETDGTSVRIHAKYALPGGARANVTYTITGDGKVEAALKWKGKAVESVPEFGLMLTLPAEYRNVAYYGMGPGETYSDFTSGAHMGLFGFDAHTALQPYFNPQESGARTGVQAAAVTDAAGFGLCLAGNGFMLSALPYTPHEVENARRQYELPPKVKTVVRCAKGQLGVAGDNTWGAGPHAEYHVALEKGETFRFTFGGMGGNG